MDVRIITAQDAREFDEFITASPNGDILQVYDWGEIKKPDWEPLRAVMIEDGRIRAAFSILFRSLPLSGFTVAYAPRGPVLDRPEDTKLITEVLSLMTGLSKEKKAIFLKIDPAVPEDKFVTTPLTASGFHRTGSRHDFGGTQPRYTYRLNLDGSESEIFARFPKKLRYKINYGPKNGLVFRANEETNILDFYQAFYHTGERNDFLTRTPAYFQKLYDYMRSKNRVLLLTGYVEGQPVISSITLSLGNKAWAIYGGQTNACRNLYTYHAMNWERIRWAKQQGAAWFDFCGVPRRPANDHHLYGLWHFKQSFGGDFISLTGEWDKPLSSAMYWLWETGLPRYRRLIRKTLRLVRK